MAATSRLTSHRLEWLLADIHAHTTGERWSAALRHLGSIKDFGLGELHLCDGAAAREHGEALRACFPADVPERVLHNLDALMKEVETLQSEDATETSHGFVMIFVLLAAAILLGWFLLR